MKIKGQNGEIELETGKIYYAKNPIISKVWVLKFAVTSEGIFIIYNDNDADHWDKEGLDSDDYSEMLFYKIQEDADRNAIGVVFQVDRSTFSHTPKDEFKVVNPRYIFTYKGVEVEEIKKFPELKFLFGRAAGKKFGLNDSILTFEDFTKKSLNESLGDGTETFTVDVSMHNPLHNLDISGCPTEWGKEIDTAKGRVTYGMELTANSDGVKEINYTLENIDLEIEVVTGDDGETETKEFSLKKEDINDDNLEVTIHDLPFYLKNLSIDFKHAENLDGELMIDKIEYSLDIGFKD